MSRARSVGARPRAHPRALVGVVVGAALTVVAGACGPVSGGAPMPAPLNACPAHPCEAYRPFTPGAADAQCNAGFCQVSAKLDYTLLVSLPETSFYAPGVSFAIPFASLFQRANALCASRVCAQLPDVAAASGFYKPLPSVQDVSEVNYFVGLEVVLPVHVSYVPLATSLGSAALVDAADLGLPLGLSVADKTLALGGVPGPGGGPSAGFYSVLPPGTYERRVEPDPPFDAAFPPDVSTVTLLPGKQFDRDVLINVDRTGQSSNRKIPVVSFSHEEDGRLLDGWTCFLRDRTTLRRVSAFARVGPMNAVSPGKYDVRLNTNHHPPRPTPTEDPNALFNTELVALPPAGLDAVPTLIVPALAGVLDVATYPSLPPPATVRGAVTSALESLPLAADVVFTSTKIYLTTSSPSFTTNLAYAARLSTTSGAPGGGTLDGRYSLLLPRGEYDVVVSPRDGAFAKRAFQLIVDVANDPQDGKNLQVDRKHVLRGSALVSDGRPLAGAEIEASPAASLFNGNGSSAPASHAPRRVTTVTDLAGNFALEIDPGTYDITVRPAAGSRLPWVVSPSRVVGGIDARLDPIEVPAPIPAGLVLRDPSTNLIVGAVVRVYALPTGGTAFVEIGRAMTDANGHYDMPLAGTPH